MNLSEAMKHFHEEPTPALLKFIDDTALRYSCYLFTKKVVGSTYKGYCTYCKKESYLESKQPLKHLSESSCPNCKSRGWIFQAGRGRGKLVDDVYVEFFEKSAVDPSVVTAAGYYVVKDYRESYLEPKLTVYRRAMYIYAKNECAMFSRTFYGAYEKHKSIYSLHNTMTFGRKLSFMNSGRELLNVLKGTPFQYALPKNKHIGNEYMLEYLGLNTVYPFVEVLVKNNCAQIVRDRLHRISTKGAINWRGKTLDKIYGLPKREWKHFRKVEEPITTNALLNYKKLRAYDQAGKVSALDLMTFCVTGYHSDFIDLLYILHTTSLTLPVAFNYMKKQTTVHTNFLRTMHSAVHTWSDYIKACLEMNLDVTSVHAMPRDLYTIHQRQIQRKKAIADAKLNLKISRRVRELAPYAIEYGDYIIKPFHSAQELTEEGHKLEHCIANYAEDYANGITDLFSIRLKSEPDIPLYSAEVSTKNKSIRQAQGLKNRAAPEAVFEALKIMLGIEQVVQEHEAAM